MSLKSKVSDNDTTSAYLVDKISGASQYNDGGNEVVVSEPHWAVITASADQATIDESVPDLVTAWNTIADGSTGHGITVSAGVVTFPAPSPGKKWEIEAEVLVTHSAPGTAQFRFYDTPAGANTAVGYTGINISASNITGIGGDVSALAWKAAAGTMGLRCTSTTGANTVDLEYEWSRLRIREVRA